MRQNSSELYLLDGNQLLRHDVVIHNKLADRMLRRRWIIQVSALSALTVLYWSTVAVTGNGKLGFDTGEGA